ncbi:polyphosphate kinase 2 [Acidihalobacter ferrooxydans]|uniref:ADP/GDP-polyphosphate phosphotransferase n=1 Tax=Acidihalobacter ferrooxydans TaxID=1765967 RepID=A0A1P8UF13_9GAMM|nr:polyphosphate kinase 2 [Acidihalobacter ferrooxydans]APZ42430.1 polyphosphate kinase 2 [Acidihalobacter ferrooxydans]
MPHHPAPAPYPETPSKKDYKHELLALQIELVKLQKHIIAHGDRILVLFEGRDSGGKDGTIKRIVQHLSPRETRVVALGKPSERDRTSWYFQRYVPHLPAAEEMVLFNRSWYNRAGVERVMGFCTDAEYEEFMETVPAFEQMLIRSGIHLIKYYLDISKDEQKKRLAARRKDPLKQWKMSPIDAVAQKHWRDYSEARDAMFARTHSALAPWTIARADDKKLTRLSIIKDLLNRLDYADKDHELIRPNPDVVFPYAEANFANGMIAA